jgi:hypothetical protein
MTYIDQIVLFLMLQEIDDLLTGALTPDDEEAVEEELEKIIQAEMPEVPSEELSAAGPQIPDVPAEPGSQKDCGSLSFSCHALCSQFKKYCAYDYREPTLCGILLSLHVP